MQDYLPLLTGFAPLIGIALLPAVLALLYSMLLCSAEQMLSGDDETPVPEPDPGRKWHPVSHPASPLLPDYLSLKEHSPPALRIS